VPAPLPCSRRFRLIDLGAAACLRTGTNYKPLETILDPCYCPPEEVRHAVLRCAAHAAPCCAACASTALRCKAA